MDLLPFAIGGAVLADWSPVSLFFLFFLFYSRAERWSQFCIFHSPRLCFKNVSHGAVLGDSPHHGALLSFCLIRTLASGK